MATVTGAGAAGFANVKPEDLAQDFGGDQSKVIGAAFEGTTTIVEAIDKQLDKQQEEEDNDKIEFAKIQMDMDSEQKRLRKWKDLGNLDNKDFDIKSGFTVKHGQVIYENQIKLAALQLKGGERRRFKRNERRTGKGKDSRYRESDSLNFSNEGDVFTDDGTQLNKKEKGDSGKAFRRKDYEITETEKQIFESQPSLDYRGRDIGPSKTDIASLASLTNDQPNILASLKSESLEYDPDNNPITASFVTALDKGTAQLMYDYDNQLYNYVWKGPDGKVLKRPALAIQKNGIAGIGEKLQEDVTAGDVGEAIGLKKLDKVQHLDNEYRQQTINNFNNYMNDDKLKQAYMNKYDIDPNLIGDGDGIVTNEELFGHFQEVYGGVYNAYYKKSLKTAAPVKGPGLAQLTVQTAVNTLDDAIASQDGGSLVGQTIGNTEINPGATIKNNILTNRTPVAITDGDLTTLEGLVDSQGEVIIETDSGRITLNKVNWEKNVDKIKAQGNSITVLKDINLGLPGVVESYVNNRVTANKDLSSEERKGAFVLAGTKQGRNYSSAVTGTSSDGSEHNLILQNKSLEQGSPVKINGPNGPENAKDGVYEIKGKNGRIQSIEVVGGSILGKPKDIVSGLTSTEKVLVNPRDKESWAGINVIFKPRSGLGFDAQITPQNVGKLITIFETGVQGNEDKENNRGNTRARLTDSDLSNSPIKWAYKYYLKTGKLHPGLLNGGTEADYNEAISNNNSLGLIL